MLIGRVYIHTSDKTLSLSTLIKIHLKTDVIDGSIVYCSRQPIIYSFILDKPPRYKIIHQPKTIHYKKEKNRL